MDAAPSLVLLAALIAANLPFIGERLFFVIALPRGKGLGWRLLELLALYFLAGFFTHWLEVRQSGTAYAQGWEFYAITLCLFLVFAFPGFVFRYLWRPPRKTPA